MRMKRIFYFMALLVFGTLLPSGMTAQNKLTVNGNVSDPDGEPLIGVSVYEVGNQTNGVATDLDGNYQISITEKHKLIFSYLGFESQEIVVKKTKLDVVLFPTESSLDQVVVTGYAQTNIRKMTGSVNVVQAKELKDAPLANVDYLLKGKMAGVNVQAVSGRPGEVAKIRIRGQSTITGNAEPLWVIDGVPMQQDMPEVSSSQIRSGDFTNIFASGVGGINPNDIESISVLKDAAAAAIYGSQASGGVIVVQTKKGSAGKTHVNYMGSVSVQTRPSRSADLMNAPEKLAWEQELWDEFSAPGFIASQSGVPTHYPVIGVVGMIRSGLGKFAGMTEAEQDAYIEELGQHSTDWFGELFRNSIATSHHLSVSGGSNKVTYYTSLGYGYNDGIVLKTNYDSYNFNAKIDVTPNDRLIFGVKTDFSYRKSESPSNNVNMFTYAYFANPYERPYNDDGSYRADETYFSLSENNGSYMMALPENGFNIMREINETSSKSTSASFSIQGNLNYKITKHLRLSGLASFNYVSNFSDNINGKDTYAAFQDRPFENNTHLSKRVYGSIFQNSSYNASYMIRGQLNYSQVFNKIHSLGILGGAEVRSSYAKSMFEKRYGFDPVSGNHSTPVFPQTGSGSIDYDKLIRYGKILDGCMGQSITENAFASFYGTIDYILMNRYVFSVTARSDGSNNFGSDEQFNLNWSCGFSWNIDEENFIKNTGASDVISSMTLRLAMGYTGGVNKTVYPIFIMDYDNSFRMSESDMYRIGSIRNAPNPKLRWERTRDMKVGLEMGFFKERLNLQVEAYHRKGMDLVTKVAVPVTTGFGEQSYNTSEQVNQGIEISLGVTPVKIHDFTWRITSNISYNRNELTKYISPTGSVYGDYYVGYPLSKIFTGKCDGINPETGLYSFQLRPDADLTQMDSYRRTENYLFYVGTRDAPWHGGITMSFSYKSLTLSTTGSFVINSKILNNINSPAYYSLIQKSSSTVDTEPVPTPMNDLYTHHLNGMREVRDRWTPGNPRTDAYPRLIDAFAGRLLDSNGHYLNRDLPNTSTITKCTQLENISYFKIGSVALIYSLPKPWVRKMHMSNMSFSFTMNNIYTFTNYSGIDPETPGAVYPQCRSFSFGLSIGF